MGPQTQDPKPSQEDNLDLPERRGSKRPAARGTAFYPRKRANTACQVCRARKTKCDNQKPTCSYCLSVGAKCIQSPVDLSAFDPASLKILERLDELESLIKEPWNAAQGGGIDSPGDLESPKELSSANAPYKSTDDLNDIPLRSILPEKVESLLLWSAFGDRLPRNYFQIGRAHV